MPHSPHKTEDEYATVIQSQWRGHQVRRSMQGAPGSLSAHQQTPAAAPTPSKARSVAASRAASNAEALLAAQASQQLLQQASGAGGLGVSSRAASMQPPQPQHSSSHASGQSMPSSTSSQSLQQQQQLAPGGLPAQASAASYRSSSSSQQAAAVASQHSSRSSAPSQHPFDVPQSASAAGNDSYGNLPQQQASQASFGAGGAGSQRGSLSAQSSAYQSVYEGSGEQQGAGLAQQRSKQAAGLSKAPSGASLPPSISQQQLGGVGGPSGLHPEGSSASAAAAAAVGSLRPSAAAASQAASAAASRQPSSGCVGAPGSTHSSSRQPGPPSQQTSWGPGAAGAGAASFGGFGPPQQPQEASPGHRSGATSAASSRPGSAAPSQKSLHAQAQGQPLAQQPSQAGIASGGSSRSLAGLPAQAPPGPAIPSALLPPGSGVVGGRGTPGATASPAPRPAVGFLGTRRGPAGGRLAAEASVADEVDPDKRLMVKNVGALRAASARRRPPPEVELLEEWRSFAGRQAERFVPAPPNASRLVKTQSQPYRIRVHCVKGLPHSLPSSSSTGSSSPRKGAPGSSAAAAAAGALPGTPGSSYEFQLGVSMYDEALGAFYGATCYSNSQQALSVPGVAGAAQQGLAGPGAAAAGGGHLSVDFGFDAFFHSRIADPQCMAVVEVILVDRSSSKSSAGAPQGRYSVGWAMLPLFPSAAASAGLGGAPGGAATPGQQQSGQVMVMPVLAGTPRYLMFRSVQAGELPPPRILEGCHVVFQVEPHPGLSPAQCLVPPDFLVTSRELIPGLRRFKLVTQAGQQVAAWSSDIKGVTSTLPEPVLSPVTAVTLSGMTVSVPQLLHSLLATLPHLKGARTPPHDLSTALAVTPAPTAVRYMLQYGVHNGRCFVGPLLSTPELVVAPQLGVVALQVPPGVAAPLLPWVLQDVNCVVVVQLLATQAVPPAHAAPVVVGRAAFSPHLAVAPDGNTAELAAGPHRYVLASCRRDPDSCSSLWPTGGTPALFDWRTLLQDTATQLLPDPTVAFHLEASAVTPGMPGTPAAAAALAPVAAPGSARQLATARTGSAPPSQAPTPPPPPPQQQASERALQLGAERAQSGFVDTPRTNAAVAAAQELERAATMPLEEQAGPSALPPGARDMLAEAWHHQQMVAAAAAANQGSVHPRELASITETMQVQLHQLARAVAELKEERVSLRQSLNLQSSVLQAAAAAAAASAASRPGSPVLLGLRQGSPDPPGTYPSAAAAAGGLSPEEQQLFDSLPGVRHAGVAAAGGGGLFQGAVADGEVMGGGGYSGLPLSRALMQQLHEAGMQHALPSDVRHALQRAPQGASSRAAAPLTPATLPMALDLEAKDARTRSEVILQLLSFKPSGDSWGAAGSSAVPSCLYFTMQLYQFEAVVTEAALLSGAGEGGYRVILPVTQGQQAGAGLVLKHVVDGSEVPLAPGVSPGKAAHAEHLAFCSYLASRALVVDVWDGESLLQLGSATINLQGLLRQGRELAELLVEAPISSCDAPSTSLPSSAYPGAPAAAPAAGSSSSSSGKGVVGQLVVRVINVGRPSCRGATRPEEFDCGGQGSGQSTPVKKVRCRAVPYEPSSPVAQELCGLSGGANPNSPFSIDWAVQEGTASTASTLRGTLDPNQTQQQQQQQQQQGMLGSGPLGATGSPRTLGATTSGNVTADILNFEHRKMVRERHLRQLSASPNGSPSRGTTLQRPGSPWSPGSPLGSPSATLTSTGAAGVGGAEGDQGEAFKELQRQMLADVAAVRRRQKASFMKSQLRKGLVTQHPVSCCPGETRLLLYTLSNPLPREAIFSLTISHPQLLQPIEQRQELQLLKAALDQSCVVQVGGSSSSSSGAGGGPGKNQEGQAAAGITPLHELASRQLAGGQQQEGKQGVQEQLSNGGKIFLAANEAVVVPFKYVLPRTARSPLSRQQGPTGAAAAGGGEPGGSWWLEPHTVLVEFIPEGHSHPAAALELLATPKPLIVDRTLRYYCPERDLLQMSLPLSSSASSRAGGLPGPAQVITGLGVAGGANWTAVSENQQVMLAVAAPAAVPQQQQLMQGGRGHNGGSSSSEAGGAQLSLRFKCGPSPEVCHFHVWVYADALQARPLEVWQVFVHSLKKVDITAQVGSTTTAALAIRGAASDRQVATYSSKPSLLQPQPPHMLLPAGGVAELGLVFRPVTTGTEQVRVHLVDVGSRELAQAFIVAVTGTAPAYNRSFEVEVPVGASIHKKVSYSNPYQQQRSLLLSTNLPAVLSFQPQHVDLPPGGNHPIGMVFSGPAAAAAAGVAPGAQAAGQQVELFVFLNDVDERGEECWRVVVRLV